MLGYPDPDKPYILYTDASHDTVGACLMQPTDEKSGLFPGDRNEKPIYYLSHKLSATQARWSTIEKEAFAIHYALQKLDHYLHNAIFIIRTDHCPLRYILESPIQNKKIQLWALSIAGYNCKIEYVAGTDNSVADLLSRMPHNAIADETVEYSPDLNDNTYQIGALNSNKFSPKQYARCQIDLEDNLKKPSLSPDINMIQEQEKDEVLMQIKVGLKTDKLSPSLANKYVVHENILYYISNADSDPVLRLYIPSHLKQSVITQYHDFNGHLGVDKTYDTIKQKYYWPNMYKELLNYVSSCVDCQTRNLQKIRPPLQETDIPPYPFAKVGVDISGPYPTSLSGNKYILSFIDLFSGYPEAFPVPDKSTETVAHILINEMFPRYGCFLEIQSDNGLEFTGRFMKETLEALNIHHVKTTFYHPQSSKIERYHRVLGDVLSKKLQDDLSTWDLHLNQTIAAIRFNVSEASKFSPFFLLFNRDVVLPLDTILKPRRKYMGSESHKISLQQQHKSFLLVHQNLKRARRKKAKYANKNAKLIKFEVGDPVYYKNFTRKSKLESKWKPYFRILEQTSPVTYIIKNQLTGATTKVHAEQIRLANIEDWDIPTENGRPLRAANYVVPPVVDNSNDSGSAYSADSDSENDVPLAKLAKRYRQERNNSDSESSIPLLELRKRLYTRNKHANYKEQLSEFSQNDKDMNISPSSNSDKPRPICLTKQLEVRTDVDRMLSSSDISDASDGESDKLDINELGHTSPPRRKNNKFKKLGTSVSHKDKYKSCNSSRQKMKQLLRAINGLL